MIAMLCAVALFAGRDGFSQPAEAPSAAPSTAASDGPTPYPKESSAWPGKGAIRVFPYMTDNRKAFWRERESRQGSIVLAGDSLVGNWRTMSSDFPGLPIANRGIGGEPTRGLLFRFTEDVLDLNPQAIVLLTGTNDLSARQDIDAARSNIVDMLDLAERTSPGVPIVLCTLPPRNNPKSPVDAKLLTELNKLIASAAQGRPNVVVLDLFKPFADPDGSPHTDYFAEDRMHFSGPGYQRFRDELAPVLTRLKAG